jgi:copper(I)-binding protein
MSRLLGLVASLLIASSAPTLAHEVKAGPLEIIHANIPQPPKGAKSAAGYMAISNEGPEADRLIGVEAGFAARAMLHQTTTNAEGVATMAHVPALDIPPGDTVVLEPGSYHIMLMGLNTALAEGQLLPATLIFEKAGPVQIEFMVDPPGVGGTDHASHEDHAAAGHGSHDAHSAGAPAHAHGIANISQEGLSDPAAIEAVLMAQFHTPDNPLTVAPVTVMGAFAVAGWAQEGAGGRAFLRKDADGWFVEFCAGAGLLAPETLTGLGLSDAEATTLIAAVMAAEAPLGPEAIAGFDSFEGFVPVGKGMAHGG